MSGSPLPSLVRFPPGAVFARYAPQPDGSVQVVSLSGQVLGDSFFEIRHLYSFVCSVSGAGCWVVLEPVQIQTPLF